MLEFKIGERVWFRTDLREVEGVLVRYNRKSVTVVSDSGERWTGSPGFLQRSASSNSAAEARKRDRDEKGRPVWQLIGLDLLRR